MSVQPAAPADTPPVEDGEDLIIDIQADAPLEDEVSQQAAPEQAVPEKPAEPEAPVAPAVGLEDIQRQLAEKETRAKELEEQNRRLTQEREQYARIAAESQQRGMSVEEAHLEALLSLAQQAVDGAKRDLQAAYESGDAGRLAEAQEKIASLASDRRDLERQKASFLANKGRNVVQVPQADPIERALAGYTPTTQAFLRENRHLLRSDGTLKRVALDAHEAALDDGYSVDTPEYFESVKKFITAKNAPAVTQAIPAPQAVPPKPQGRPPSVAAPVARSAPTSIVPDSDGAFRLTPKMRALAEASGAPDSISYKDWAKEYLRMVKSGEMQPIE